MLKSDPFCKALDANTTVHLMTVNQRNCCRENSLGEEVLETLCFTLFILSFISLIGLLIITIFEAKRLKGHGRKESQMVDDEIGYIEFVRKDLEKGAGVIVKSEATIKSMNEIKDLYEEIPEIYAEAYAMQVIRDDSEPPPEVMEDDNSLREDEGVNYIMEKLFLEPIRNAQSPPSPIPCTLPRMVEEEPIVNTNWNSIRKQLKRIRNMKVGMEGGRDSLADIEGVSPLSWRSTIMEEVNRKASFTGEERTSGNVTQESLNNFSPSDQRSSSVISGLSTASRDSRLSTSSCRNSSITSDGSTDYELCIVDHGGGIMSHKPLRRSFKRKKVPKVSPRARNSSSSSLCGKTICMSPELEHKGAGGRRVGIMKKSPSNGALNNYRRKRRQGVSFDEQEHISISRHPNRGETSGTTAEA